MLEYTKYLDRLPDYLRMKGIEINNGLCRCLSPLHEDKNPSCRIAKSAFHCFGCGISGDIYDAVELLDNIPPDKKIQFRFVENLFNKAEAEAKQQDGNAKPLDAIKEKLVAIRDTINSGSPQVNKNRRIRSLVKMALAEAAEVEAMLDFIKDFYKQEVNHG